MGDVTTNISGSQEYLENGAYEIYVSKDIDDLFKAESLVFAYDNMSDSKNGTSYSQLISFTDNKPVIFQFQGLRINTGYVAGDSNTL